MDAPERYMLVVRYPKARDFVPVWFPFEVWLPSHEIPEGNYFEWDKAVEMRARLIDMHPGNTYMLMPVVADPISGKLFPKGEGADDD